MNRISETSFLLLLIIFTHLIAFSTIRAADLDQTQTTSTLLISAPLSGNLADIGKTMEYAARLAHEKFDLEGKIKLKFDDHQYSAAKAVSSLRAALAQEKPYGLIVFGSGPSIAVASIAEQNSLPMIGISISDDFTRNKNHVARMFCSVEQQVDQLIREAKRRGYERVALLSVNNDATLRIQEQFARTFEQEVVFQDHVEPGETNFRSIALKMGNLKPDAVLLTLLPPLHSLVAAELRAVGYKGEIFAAAPIQSKSELERGGLSLEGAWFSTAEDSGTQSLQEEIHRQYGFVAHPDGLFAYDATKHFVESYLQELPKPFVIGASYNGVYGTYPLSKDRSFDIPVTLKVIKNGAFHPLSVLEKDF